MELDLDSFLRSRGSDLASLSSDDDYADANYRRTIDEILNESDSDSESQSIPLSLRELDVLEPMEESSGGADANGSEAVAETLTKESSRIFNKRGNSGTIFSSASLSSQRLGNFPNELKTSTSRPLPSLFGGIRPNPKPGAALAAAVAASRSIPTPHAAAIKSKRAIAVSIPKEPLSLEAAEAVHVEATAVSGIFDVHNVVSSASSSGRLGDSVNDERFDFAEIEVPSGSSSSSRIGASDLEGHDSGVTDQSISSVEVEMPEKMEADLSCSAKEAESSRQLVSKRSLKDLPSPVSPSTDIDENVTRMIENLSFVKETNANAENVFGTYETGLKAPETEFAISYDKNFGDGRGSCIGEELNTFSEVDDLVEKGDNGMISKKVEKISHTYIKPLDRVEELEKRKASFGLHWEEGAAAQPMKLEGIHRGPPAVGFLQIDLDNMITRAISSQTFKQDHGSPMVLAVHINFVAIGTSKGSILIFPSKYYPQHVDSMDGKMLIFGSTVEKIQVSVTSMCFNQQGDLLLAGYSDGHLTIWDVQRGTSSKSITGEHNAPVTHTLFVGQDSQSSRQFKVVTGDSKGLVLLHTSSVLPLLNHFSIKTQCLLDGDKTGTVLCACPVIMDYSLDVCSTSTQVYPSLNASGLGSKVGGVVGGVVGGDTGWKLFNGNPSVEEGVVIFATNQNALVVRLSPSVEVYEKLSRPDGVREGSMPYAAWKCIDASDKAAWLAIAWDRKIQIAKLVKSELKKCKEWILDNEAIGVAWLDDQIFVVLTTSGQLCLFTRDGEEINQTSIVRDCPSIDDFIIYNTQYVNSPGNPEKSYHNSVAVRGSTIYILGPMHLIISRLLPWKERIQLLQKAGDWMGALDMAMKLYDGHTHGVIDLPRTVDAIRDVIMPYLVELILFYVDEVFSYISIAFCNQIDKLVLIEDPNISNSSVSSEVEEQYSRVGGVAVEFCVHVKRTDVLFDGIFSKFVAVQHGGTFLEILEPYILRDMLGCIPPEIMQALVEHYSSKGWLERVEQCILHMDISSVDFNQVVRLCREHGLYGALIYLFNRGLDDFKAPLEELLQAVQCSSSMDVATIGYRLLVYLKYSFQGLAFPPGHGCLHPSRLPSVREELLNFLLEDSKESILQVANRLKLSYRNFPNLCHILCLDTEATLDVLKCAFKDAEPVDDQSVNDQAVVLLVQENHHELENSKTQQTLVQRTADVLISILDLESDLVDPSEIVDDTDAWPSESDINLLLEFIAYLVANKQAQVSATVLKHILKYLTSLKLAPESLENKASQKEKQVLSLLKAVPQEIWNFSCVLSLCMEANFYQACGFIHSMSREYVSALDSYMKDIDEPVHAFSFVNKMLLQLKGTEALSFQSAVIQRIPELVKLSRECTFILVIDQLGGESQNILSQLHSHPQSLFLFLKTVIDVHMSGTLNFSVPEASCDFDTHNLRLSDTCNELKDYFKKISNLPKVLHNDMIQVTDELTELYLELLCQYESNSVLKFLETFDNYRLENCLKICQEYGVKDAAAFLLERVGDVGSALVLLMSGIDEKIELLVTTVQNKFNEMTSRKLSDTEWLAKILELKEAYAVRDVLHASVGLCQRNTQRLDRQESDSLWFHLFDSFSEQLRRLCSDKEVPEWQNNIGNTSVASSTLVDGDGYLSGLRCSKFPKCANILRRVFSQFIGEVIEGMVGYLPLPVVMSKLLSDNGNQEFGDFKMTILKTLGTYNYERRILDTAKSLIEDDIFYTMGILKKGASHALAPQNLICCFCGLPLTKDSSSLGIRIFNCGHATHLHCECEDNEQSNPHAAFGCPVCQLKKNPQARNKFASSENGLVNNTLQSSGHSRLNSSLQHLHETDVLDKSYRLHQMSRFDMLSNLQKGKALPSETLPQLRLAPPALYHEKVQKGPVSSSQVVHEATRKKEKTSKRWQIMELKSKGSLSGLPLKSSIFGPEKNRGR